MTRRVSLEDFEEPKPRLEATPAPAPQPVVPDVDIDAVRSAGYEEGYKSGWDDCQAENVKNATAASSNLAQSLADISVTYEDARREVLSGIKPLIDAIVTQLLPKMAADGIATLVAAELQPLLDSTTEQQPEIHCSEATEPVLRKMLEQRPDISITLRRDTSLPASQVALRLGAEKREVDLSAAIEKIGTELEQFTNRLITQLPPSG